MSIPSWPDRAACRGDSPYLWTISLRGFQGLPESKAQKARNEVAFAKCASCPVSAECLDEGLRFRDRWTIRAGMLPSERRPLELDVEPAETRTRDDF